MSWNFERATDLFVTSPNDIAWDGRYLWSSKNSVVNLTPYEVFDRSHVNDIVLVAPAGGGVGFEQGNEFLNPITLADTKTISVGGYWIAPYGNGAFVSQGKTFSSIKFIDAVLGQSTLTITCPKTMNSNLLYCNGKLWMADNTIGGDQLYLYNIATQSWTQTTIPATEQVQLRYIEYDKSGFVLIPNFNNLVSPNICKYGVDGTYISTLQCTNKEPIFVTSDEDKNVFLSSYNGMISSVDTSADTVTDFAYNGHGNDPQSNGIHDLYFINFWGVSSDGTYLWISTGGDGFNRMEISTKHIVGTHVEEAYQVPAIISTLPDGNIVPVVGPATTLTDNGDGSYTEVTPSVANTMDENYSLNMTVSGTYKKVITIPTMTKQVWNGSSFDTKTYNKQVILATSSSVYALPNDKLWRSNFVQANAVAMIATGPNNYTGD